MAPGWTSFENLNWQWSNINWMIAGLLGLYVLALLVQALRRHRRHGNASITETGFAESDLKTSQQVSWTGRQLFHQSLHAALTLEEIRQLVVARGGRPECVSASSDRHWTICGRWPIR